MVCNLLLCNLSFGYHVFLEWGNWTRLCSRACMCGTPLHPDFLLRVNSSQTGWVSEPTGSSGGSKERSRNAGMASPPVWPFQPSRARTAGWNGPTRAQKGQACQARSAHVSCRAAPPEWAVSQGRNEAGRSALFRGFLEKQTSLSSVLFSRFVESWVVFPLRRSSAHCTGSSPLSKSPGIWAEPVLIVTSSLFNPPDRKNSCSYIRHDVQGPRNKGQLYKIDFNAKKRSNLITSPEDCVKWRKKKTALKKQRNILYGFPLKIKNTLVWVLYCDILQELAVYFGKNVTLT